MTLNSKLKKQFPFLTFCLWETYLLNEFMVHQPGRFFLLVEVEKAATESVFYYLKENKHPVFHEPNEDIINKYFPEDIEPIVIRSLVSEAPIRNIKDVITVTLEKMLVDVFSDDVIFSAQHGSELINIFITANDKYTVNENRMLRYADRRGKKVKLINFLNSVTKFEKNKQITALL